MSTPASSETTPAFVLEHFLPYRLNHLADRISASLSQVYRDELDMTVSEWRAFALYGEHDRLTAKQISSMSRMDKTRVSRVISELDRKGLIERHPHESDKRASYISLSPAGHRLLNTLLPRALGWEDKLFQEFDTREYRELFRLITQLDKSIPADPAAPEDN